MEVGDSYFEAFYTPLLYKQKKRKSWQEGKLIYFSHRSRAVLYDEQERRLDSVYVKADKLCPDAEIDMDRHLVLIGSPVTSEFTPIPPVTQTLEQKPKTSSRHRKAAFKMPRLIKAVADGSSRESNVTSRDYVTSGSHVTNILPAQSKHDGALPLPAPSEECKAPELGAKSRWAVWAQHSSEGCSQRADAPCEFLARKQEIKSAQRRMPSAIHPKAQTLDLCAEVKSFPEMRQQIFYPDPYSLSQLKRGQAKRTFSRVVRVPPTFATITEYVSIFTKAILEHLQLLLYSHSYKLYSAHASLKNNPSGVQLERYLASKQIAYYHNCSLDSVQAGVSNITFCSTERFIGMQDNFYLHLSRKEASSSYSKDDLWVLATSLTELLHGGPKILAKSVFYGPQSQLDLELTPLGQADAQLLRSWLNANDGAALGEKSFCAIRILNMGTEAMMLEHLDHQTLCNSPIVQSCLLSAPTCESSSEQPATISEKVIECLEQATFTYHLNEDQANVLKSVVSSCLRENLPGCRSTGRVTICYGVFGSGKSYLAAVIVLVLLEVYSMLQRNMDAIVLSSMSNVAVDRILIGLLEQGFKDFRRAGSVKKIDKQILPYLLRSSDNLELKDQIKELEDMLRYEKPGSSEMASIKLTLQRLKSSSDSGNSRIASVVGATCAACVFDVLSNVKASLLIMDECSQMTEPLSLIPITKFRPSCMLLIGDPAQLAPTVTTPYKSVYESPSHGFEWTLLERLAALKVAEPIMLKTQYRCHPAISRVASDCFYNSQLKDGIAAADRTFQSSKWAPIVFKQVVGGQEALTKSSSFYNRGEAVLAVQLLENIFFAYGDQLSSDDIGVVCLYKGQVDFVRQLLQERAKDPENAYGYLLQDVTVSTVDAFQGAEKDVIIVLTVRTAAIGFIDEPRRVNVAITRARRHLFILGSRELLSTNALWRRLLNSAQADLSGRLDDINKAQNSRSQRIELADTQVLETRVLQTRDACPSVLQTFSNSQASSRCAVEHCFKESEQAPVFEHIIKSPKREMSVQINYSGHSEPTATSPISVDEHDLLELQSFSFL